MSMSWLRALVVTVALSLAASAPAVPAETLQPLVVGWERFFKLTWTVGDHKGRPAVAGHIYNDWGFAAANMRLLVDELDASGQVIDQRLSWLGFTLTPGTTAPFEIAVTHPTPNYRVSVFAFDWVQTGDGDRNRF